ncbi:MAG: glycosyltransferase family 4 protein [Vicinamibacterales bacterium]
MRILVDYRPALRERTGVGEYVHELVRAYTALPEARDDQLSLFTSSWKDRPAASVERQLGARLIDRRVPVRLLNYAWHRLESPPIEWLAGDADVVHGLHPLLIPARRAAQVVTIHDLFFLDAPARARAEIRRDYASLAPAHARRAHAVLAPSRYTAGRIERELGVAPARVYVCPPGPPAWSAFHAPGSGFHDRLTRPVPPPRDGVVLFIGTLEARKNVGALLEAYRILLRCGDEPPPLRLVGRATPDAAGWLEDLGRAPLAGRVVHTGYIGEPERAITYGQAKMLVMPSLDEGFGLPVLEAMASGVPVIASNRGSLPEVLGGAGMLVEPHDHEGLAAAIRRVMNREVAEDLSARGLARARDFSWARTAATVRQMYLDAVARRQAGD